MIESDLYEKNRIVITKRDPIKINLEHDVDRAHIDMLSAESQYCKAAQMHYLMNDAISLRNLQDAQIYHDEQRRRYESLTRRK